MPRASLLEDGSTPKPGCLAPKWRAPITLWGTERRGMSEPEVESVEPLLNPRSFQPAAPLHLQISVPLSLEAEPGREVGGVERTEHRPRLPPAGRVRHGTEVTRTQADSTSTTPQCRGHSACFPKPWDTSAFSRWPHGVSWAVSGGSIRMIGRTKP